MSVPPVVLSDDSRADLARLIKRVIAHSSPTPWVVSKDDAEFLLQSLLNQEHLQAEVTRLTRERDELLEVATAACHVWEYPQYTDHAKAEATKALRTALANSQKEE